MALSLSHSVVLLFYWAAASQREKKELIFQKASWIIDEKQSDFYNEYHREKHFYSFILMLTLLFELDLVFLK